MNLAIIDSEIVEREYRFDNYELSKLSPKEKRYIQNQKDDFVKKAIDSGFLVTEYHEDITDEYVISVKKQEVPA